MLKRQSCSQKSYEKHSQWRTIKCVFDCLPKAFWTIYHDCACADDWKAKQDFCFLHWLPKGLNFDDKIIILGLILLFQHCNKISKYFLKIVLTLYNLACSVSLTLTAIDLWFPMPLNPKIIVSGTLGLRNKHLRDP